MVNLASLRKQNLLKSKDYGLGKENLWSLKAGRALAEIQDLFDTPLVSPRSEVHAFKYEHEKACGDVFVTLALTGNLRDWLAHVKLGRVIPDRIAQLGDDYLFIEMEMGSQDKIADKLAQYQSYHRETREQFDVLFLVQHQKQYDTGLRVLAGAGKHYRILTSEMLSDMYSLPAELDNTESPMSTGV